MELKYIYFLYEEYHKKHNGCGNHVVDFFYSTSNHEVL
jgi:hypothetical protein